MSQILPSTFRDGTATVANGGTVVTGQSVLWLNDVLPGDFFGTHRGIPIRIATVDTNTQLTLAYPWPGATQTAAAYEIMLQSDNGRMQETSRELLTKMQSGTLDSLAGLSGNIGDVIAFSGPGVLEVVPKSDLVEGVNFDVQVDTLAERSAYDAQGFGYVVLVSDVGDGRSAVYSKASNTVGDWSDPAFVTGPIGPAFNFAIGTTTTLPPGSAATVAATPISGGESLSFGIPSGRGFAYRGAYNPATAYVLDDGVVYNGSSWIAIASTTGNPPPTLPTTSNAYWSLYAIKGTDGTGIGDVVGPAGVTDGNAAVFDTTTGKLIKQSTPAQFRNWLALGTAAPLGRLTLVSGVPVSVSDVAGAPTIYYTPYIGNLIEIFNGTLWVSYAIPELSIALDNASAHAGYHQSGKNFDLFVFNDAGTIRLGTGPAWSSDTARGTGAGTTEIEIFQGLLANKNAISLRWGSASGNFSSVAVHQAMFVGSFRASADGQSSDMLCKRLLSNAYNTIEKPFNEFVDTTASWNYSVATMRIANGNTNTKASLLFCLDGVSLSVSLKSKMTSNAVTANAIGLAIYVDGAVAEQDFANVPNGTYFLFYLFLRTSISSGYHEIAPYEQGAGVNVQNWIGATRRMSGSAQF